MNTANILAVADAIEQHTIPWLGFNLGPFLYIKDESGPVDESYVFDRSGHNCGTVACIAGHAIILKHNIKDEPASAYEAGKLIKEDFLRAAAEWLGIPYGDLGDISDQLFFAHGGNRSNISADQAVRTLRHLAATGTVDWTV